MHTYQLHRGRRVLSAHALPCVHLGPETGEHRACLTCPGSVRLKLHGCARHGVCTTGKALPGVACCVGCPDAAPVAPVADNRVGGLPAGRSFNGSIAAWAGRTWLAYRKHWEAARIVLVELGADWQPRGAAAELELGELAEDRGGQEDPRLFVHRDRLHVSYSGLQWAARNRLRVSVCVARLDQSLRVERSWCPQYGGRQEWEKNWGLFEHEGDLYAVHTIQGHRVLLLHHDAYDAHHWGGTLPGAAYGELRGGAPPVRAGGEFYSFFHGRHLASGLYTVGCYTFSASPPFHPLRFARAPLLYPDPASKPGPGVADVVFPGGAVLRDSHWHVCYGSYDSEVRVASWAAGHVEHCLEALP